MLQAQPQTAHLTPGERTQQTEWPLCSSHSTETFKINPFLDGTF